MAVVAWRDSFPLYNSIWVLLCQLGNFLMEGELVAETILEDAGWFSDNGELIFNVSVCMFACTNGYNDEESVACLVSPTFVCVFLFVRLSTSSWSNSEWLFDLTESELAEDCVLSSILVSRFGMWKPLVLYFCFLSWNFHLFELRAFFLFIGSLGYCAHSSCASFDCCL